MHTSTTAERATRSLPPVTPEQRAAALAAKTAAKAAWSPVRHPSKDEQTRNVAVLALFGIRRVDRNEPATVARMRQLARRAGISQGQLEEAVGYSLAEWLALNPGWPPVPPPRPGPRGPRDPDREKRDDVDQVA